MLQQIMESFLSKVGEKLVDYAQGTVINMKDYKHILETMERNFRKLSAQAADVEAEINNAELSGKKKRKREVENWLTEVKELENEITKLEADTGSVGFLSNFFTGNRAQYLNERVAGLVEQKQYFGGVLLDDCEPKRLPFLTRGLVGEMFKANLEKICDFLIKDQVQSIGIYGMGGSGKTTLAKEIHNRLLQRTQQYVIWITVSQTFTINGLQDEIAHAMHLNLSNEHQEYQRAARLNQVLSGKKSVVIFDDVWENISLEEIGIRLSSEGCRLILTTRSFEVCSKFGCQEIVPVKTLNKSEAINLFEETLGAALALPPQVQAIAKHIVEKCGGLPLAIITAAGSMKGKTDICEWRNALTDLEKSIIRGDNNEEMVFKILKYSFDQLDHGEEKHYRFTMSQHCFLYCCLYPEDKKIKRTELIDMFIAEELLEKQRSRRQRIDQGHVILNKLVNVCLLEGNGRWWVKMHDLVRVMALKITKGKYMAIDVNDGAHWSTDIEKVFLTGHGINHVLDGWSQNCPKLSTLVLRANYFALELIPDQFLFEMRNLHILDLTGNDKIKELPNSLSNLKSLTALFLSGCQGLQSVPYLGNLKKLKQLDLSCTSITEVPRGMEELVNIECLKMGATLLKELPSTLLHNFSKLQCLHLPCKIEAPTREIERLKQLEEFSGRVKDVYNFNQLMGCQTGFKEYKRFYFVVVGENAGDETSDKENGVFLSGINLNEEERRDMIISAPDIKCLTLWECKGRNCCLLDGLQRLKISLESVTHFRINYCRGVECILKLEQYLMVGRDLKILFQNLEEILLYGSDDLIGVMRLERVGGRVVSPPPTHPLFSSLKKLIVFGCDRMKSLGLPFWELQNLEEIEVSLCEGIEEIIEVGDEDGEGNQLPLLLFPKLKGVRLIDLPNLKSICKATVVCNSIQFISMSGCVGVKKLPLLFNSIPSSLERIRILKSEEEWWESLELEHPSLRASLQPFIEFVNFWS